MSDFSSSIFHGGVVKAYQNEGPLGSAFQPDAVMPIQFYGRPHDDERMVGVRRLMCAILDDALRCFERNLTGQTPQKLRQFREAEYWLFRETKGKSIFSFESVCDALRVDPKLLRKVMLKRWARAMAGEAPDRLSRRTPVRRYSSTGSYLECNMTLAPVRRHVTAPASRGISTINRRSGPTSAT